MSGHRTERSSASRPNAKAGLLIVVLLWSVSAVAQRVAIDKTHSTVTVRVFKSGLLSGLAHNHVIQATIAAGSLDARDRAIELSFNVADMKVVDPEGSDSERQQIEATMKGPKVLDMAQFPVINFTSRQITSPGQNRYQATGELKLHGAARQVSVPVDFRDGRYLGSLTLKQTDYGVVPVKIAGGTVRVKDEIVIEFQIVSAIANEMHP